MTDAQGHFEREKADFLQAIQENMLILDAMLKQYALKSTHSNNTHGGGQATHGTAGERAAGTSQGGSTWTAQQLLLTIQENDEDYL